MKARFEGSAGRGARARSGGGDVGWGSTVMPPRSLLVCFSGKIGSGKTSVSCAVASELGCRWTGFGGYLRARIAERGGDPDNRQALQDLGQSRIEGDGESLCRDVLAAGGFVAGEDFVLEGVRHLGVVPHLARIAAPSEVRLIFLEADAEVRGVRVGERSDSARRDFDRATRHEVEADMEVDLPSAADAVVDGSLPLGEAVEQCIGFIQEWRKAAPCAATAAENHADVRESRPK